MRASFSFNGVLLILIACASAGCATPEDSLLGDGRVNAAGVNQLFTAEEIETVDLISLLNPSSGAQSAAPGNTSSPDAAVRLNQALNNFYYSSETAEERAQHRNRIQDRIIMASNQRCALFKTYLQNLDSDVGFGLGSLATLFGGLGAIFTEAEVARSLAGAAGITSGIHAQFDEEYFASKAISIIVRGIEKARGTLLTHIENTRTKDNGDPEAIDKYSVEAAIADAIQYHAACTVFVGLDQAEIALTSQGDPRIGLNAAIEINRILLDAYGQQEDVGEDEPAAANGGQGGQEEGETDGGTSAQTSGGEPLPLSVMGN